LLALLVSVFGAAAVEAARAPAILKASSDGRFLVDGGGRFFFYLGDTAWELFHRLKREEAEVYLRDRAAKGFTVIQAVILAEFDGLGTPNAYGHTPLYDNDPTRPNEAYFRNVDDAVKLANSLGLVMGLLPTWGDKVGPVKWGKGPEIFTPGNARAYGEFLGKRYRKASVIWILGGDRAPETERQKEIWRAMADGLRRGDGKGHLITYHPWGSAHSGDYFHDEGWLDFNCFQSGHGSRDTDNAAMIDKDYARTPPKPCLDLEPAYEDHPVNWQPDGGWFDDADVRVRAYRALFAGACGHTYGCHDIWQFLEGGRPPVSWARTPWREAINLPGSSQVGFARWLVESRPPLKRVPDQGVFARDPGNGAMKPRACRGSDGSYVLVYLPEGGSTEIRMDVVGDAMARAWWFDPRTGRAMDAGEHATQGTGSFSAPSSGRGNDWVLVLDAASRRFPPPGIPPGKSKRRGQMG
jgi:hypothetical protein